MKRFGKALCLFAVVSVGADALAQEAPARAPARPARPEQPDRLSRPPEMGPEALKAAWDLEATGVAKRMGLNDDQTKAVVKAYADARESHRVASEKLRKEMMDKMRDSGGGGGGGRGAGQESMKAMDDLATAEREKLQKALASSLNADQAAKAAGSLGSFNRQWDPMANAIGGMKLDAAKQQEALNAIEDFVVAQGKLRPQGPDTDREAMRNAMQEARQKLNDSLKKALSEDQMKQFEESLPGRGGRRGQGGGPGGGGGAGGGGGGGG